MAWSSDGKYIVSAGQDNTAKMWNAQISESIYTYQGHFSIVHAVAWGPKSLRRQSRCGRLHDFEEVHRHLMIPLDDGKQVFDI